MTVSFVLRLTPSALGVGRLSGQVEHVASGTTATFVDAEELLRWCADAAGVEAPVRLAVVPEPRVVDLAVLAAGESDQGGPAAP